MKVAVCGATGFVGSVIVKRLLSAGHSVKALVRPGSAAPDAPEALLQPVPGDITAPETLPASFEGCDAVINLVGIIREKGDQTFERIHAEGASNVVRAAEQSGVGRIVHMSALGTGQSSSGYHITKEKGETYVRNSAVGWVIMRPSLIAGRGDGFTTMLIDLMRKAPIIPVIGGGRSLMQPIAVEDVAAVFLAALEGDEHLGQTYLLGGPEQLQMAAIMRQIRRQLGLRKPLVSVPAQLVAMVAYAAAKVTDRFPITTDQLTMLQQDNIAVPNHAETVFGLSPTPFGEVLKRILAG